MEPTLAAVQRHTRRWDTIFRSGFEPKQLRGRFEKAGRSTTALLVFDGRPVLHGLFESGGGVHAEQKLLASVAWKDVLERAVYNTAPVTVAVILNRTPCHSVSEAGGAGCASQLCAALPRERPRRSPVTQAPTFELACTGIYETSGPLQNRGDQGPTSNRDVIALSKSGWTLKALQVGQHLTSRGKILAQFLAHCASADSRLGRSH